MASERWQTDGTSPPRSSDPEGVPYPISLEERKTGCNRSRSRLLDAEVLGDRWVPSTATASRREKGGDLVCAYRHPLRFGSKDRRGCRIHSDSHLLLGDFLENQDQMRFPFCLDWRGVSEGNFCCVADGYGATFQVIAVSIRALE